MSRDSPSAVSNGGYQINCAAEAAKLWIAPLPDGFTAVGTPLGSEEYVSYALARCAATVETLVESPVQLQLSPYNLCPLHQPYLGNPFNT